MRIHEVRTLGALCLAVALSGCFYTRGMRKSDKPTSDDAYIYGRFVIDAREMIAALDNHQSMGFAIRCASDKDTNTYTIRFSREPSVQVIKIAPGACTFHEIIYTDADGTPRRWTPAPAGLMKDVVFEPGTAYYLGDYGARTEVSFSGYATWDLTSVREDYEGATRELDATFPNFASIPKVNRMMRGQPDN